MKLHLGVADHPYAEGGTTTGDVAEILESKYGIMAKFAEVHADDIEGHLAEAFNIAIENASVSGKMPDKISFAAAGQNIASDFRRFIRSQEVERVGIPGTPTQAALDGKTSRKKKAKETKSKKPRPKKRRPSFRDTGEYVASFAAWTSED